MEMSKNTSNNANIYLGEKTCDVRMLENFIENPSKKEEPLNEDSEEINKMMENDLYMTAGLNERKILAEIGIPSYNGCIILREWREKDVDRIYNDDLYKIDRSKLNESALECAGKGIYLYNEGIDPKDMKLVRKGDGMMVSESYRNRDEWKGFAIPYGYAFIRTYINKFRNATEIQDLTEHELHIALQMLGMNPTEDGLYRIEDLERQLVNPKMREQILHDRESTKSAIEYEKSLEKKPAKVKELLKKEKAEKERQESIYRNHVRAQDEKYRRERERRDEMERCSQELLDKDNDLDESFSDALDSSLIDYSNEFENADKDYQERLRIKNWLDKYSVKDYIINKDYSVDVVGNVDLFNKGLEKIEVQFNKVSGNFICNHNQLTSLERCPEKVGGIFWCDHNQLTSLEGCPKEVGRDFDCAGNRLTSLEGCPEKVGGSFYCGNNKLTSDWIEEKLRTVCNIKGCISGLHRNDKNKMNESFGDALDSSLIDYSSDFENADKKYDTIRKIRTFMKDELNAREFSKINLDKLDFCHGIVYKINDDLSIDVLNVYPDKLVIDPFDYGDKKELPDYIEFNEVYGNFGWYCGKAPDNIKGFPKIIHGTIYNDLLDNLRFKGRHVADIDNWNKWIDDNYEFFNDYDDNNIKAFYYRKDIDFNALNDITNKKTVNESFSDALDSSLIDYSREFEKSDIKHKEIQKIKNYMDLYTNAMYIHNINSIPKQHNILEPMYIINENDLSVEIVYEKVFGYLRPLEIYKCNNIQVKEKREMADSVYIKSTEGGIIWEGTANDPLTLPTEEDVINYFPENVLFNIAWAAIEINENTIPDKNMSLTELNRIHKEETDTWDEIVNKYYIENKNIDSGLNEYKYTKKPEYIKRPKLDESFSDALDSSLVDYSSEFEKSDINHKKKLFINDYMHKYTSAISEDEWHNSKMSEIRLSPQYTTFYNYMHAANVISTYSIKDDYSVNINSPKIGITGYTRTYDPIFAMSIEPWESIENKEDVPIINEVKGDFVWCGYTRAKNAIPSKDTIIHCFPKKICGKLLWNVLENSAKPITDYEYCTDEEDIKWYTNTTTWDIIIHKYYTIGGYAHNPYLVLKNEYRNK